MASAISSSNSSRKRSRDDYFTSAHSTPYTSSTSWSTSFSPSTISPAPLANSRYQLDGGLDTPTAAHQAVYDKYDNAGGDYELDFRRGRSYFDSHSHYSHQSDELPKPLAHESNGRPRGDLAYSTTNNGWSRSVFSTLTGAAGKVWSFCTAGTTFKGFFAGGGQGYAMETPTSRRQENRSPSGSIWEDYDRSASATPMPGEYPNHTHNRDSPDSSDAYESSARASKKTKHTHDDEGLSANWVMVNDTPSRRKVPAQSTASPASTRRPASKAGLRRPAQLPSPLSPSRPASAAGLRSPNLPSRTKTHSRTSSRDCLPATPRSARPSLASEKPESPIAKETAEHLKKIRRREKQEDKEFRDFNRRLQDMIRQGQEALGSKVEIEMDGDDAGMW